jgi:hypothetical protein
LGSLYFYKIFPNSKSYDMTLVMRLKKLLKLQRR